MENVVVAIIIIFLLLFGVLTLSNSLMTAQATVQQASDEVHTHAMDIERTAISIDPLRILDSGSTVDVTLRNNGAVKLMDFDRWDVFAEYYDGSSVYKMERLTYHGTVPPTDNTWSRGGISLISNNSVGETYEPGILNPGEEVVLHLKLSPAVGDGQTVQVAVATGNGINASMIGRRNPPELVLDTGTKIGSGATITKAELLTQDADNTADQLTYTVVTPPTNGTLTPATTFTQAQIDDGDLFYTRSNPGVDSFGFTVTDGTVVIGPYTFSIGGNAVPALAHDDPGSGHADHSPAPITSTQLQTTDADGPDDKLIYTVTTAPTQGTLNLGTTFTQADIDLGRLTYTQTGAGPGSDSFTFVVSDGYDVIAPSTFVITLAS